VWTEVKAEDCSLVLRQTNLITNESMNYSTMNTNGVKSQIEINKEIIQHYFEGGVTAHASSSTTTKNDQQFVLHSWSWLCQFDGIRPCGPGTG
jgi:hypothetical protein